MTNLIDLYIAALHEYIRMRCTTDGAIEFAENAVKSYTALLSSDPYVRSLHK